MRFLRGPPPLRMVPSLRMVKVLEPISVKLLTILVRMPSVAVSMPIRAVIPNIIMETVSEVRSRLVRITRNARLIFSRRFMVTNIFFSRKLYLPA